MNIAYLILAHENPAHLQRLISRLSTDASKFFVHVDKKSNFKIFSHIADKNVNILLERISVFWGDYSQVDAILLLINAALADEKRFERFVLLSGSDYPLRSAASVEKFFTDNPKKEFINMNVMPADAAGKPISRLTTYRLDSGGSLWNRVVKRFLFMIHIIPSQRDYKACFLQLIPYGGSTWWALTRNACELISSFSNTERHVLDFFRNTICPDEMVFHTILGNSPLKSNIVRNLTYTDWSDGGASPAFISEKHLAFFENNSAFVPDIAYGNGQMLFARKFSDNSSALLDRFDQQIFELNR
jgi:hypothetical protein